MSVLVDSSVWSLGLRRRKRHLNADELKVYYAWEQILIRGEATIIGLIRQEVLSGVVSPREFELISQRLAPTPDLPLFTEIFVLAAQFFNTCRSAGIAAGAIDMTICAAAHIHNTPIFTTDPDFPRYAKHLPVALHLY